MREQFITVEHPDVEGTGKVALEALRYFEAKGWKAVDDKQVKEAEKVAAGDLSEEQEAIERQRKETAGYVVVKDRKDKADETASADSK